MLETFERDYLRRALEKSGGNLPEVAHASALDRSYFRRLARKYGLEP
jgi:DNA-binding NtrC family response regulator